MHQFDLQDPLLGQREKMRPERLSDLNDMAGACKSDVCTYPRYWRDT